MPRAHVAAIDATTGQLLPLDVKVSGPVGAIAADGDSLYLGGVFSSVDGQTRKNIAEVDASSGAVSAWHPSMSARVRALEVADGTLYAGGQLRQGESRAAAAIGRLRHQHRRVDRLEPVRGPAVYDLLAAPGRIYAAGAFDSVNGDIRAESLAALDPITGGLASWDPVIGYPVISLDTDGNTVFAAAAGPGGHLRAFNADSGAGVWDLTTDGNVQAVTVVDDVVYFGGHMDYVCNTTRTGYKGACLDGEQVRHKVGAASKADGTLLPFDPQAGGGFLGVWDIDSTADKLFAGGVFRTFQSGSISQPYYYAQFSNVAVLP